MECPSIHANVVDLDNAFDSIQRDFLWRILHRSGVLQNVVSMLKMMYSKYSFEHTLPPFSLAFNDWVFKSTTNEGRWATRSTFYKTYFCICTAFTPTSEHIRQYRRHSEKKGRMDLTEHHTKKTKNLNRYTTMAPKHKGG